MLILGLLGVLSIGAVVLGLAMAPPTTDLMVHNGAGETVLAPSLTALYANQSTREYIKVVYTAPDQATESLLKAGPGSPATRTVHVQGTRATKALAPFAQMQKVTGFTAKGSKFTAQVPASTLYPPRLAPAVKGTVNYVVSLTGGYLVSVLESFNVHTPVGTQTGSYQYLVTAIGGQPVQGH